MQKSDKVDTVGTVGPDRGDAAGQPAEGPSSNDPTSLSSSPRSIADDVSPGDLFGLSLDPALAELADEFSRRLLTGETVDVEALVAAHPDRADAFKKLMPVLRGIARLEPVDTGPGHAAGSGAHPNGPAAGKVFADFHIVREIGRGGMGIVFEARQTALGRRVALKVLPQAAAMDPKALKRFELEAQVAGLLQHPHIVPVHAVGSVDGVPYFAMQYIEGGSLAGLIAELRGLVERGADHVVSASSGDSPSALALGLLTGRFAPLGRESDTGRHDTAAPRPDVGWRRAILGIVRPTERRGGCGGPPPDVSGLGATLRNLTGRFAPLGRESDTGRHDAAAPRPAVGWRRTILGIVRPTERRGGTGGPPPDVSGLGTTVRNLTGRFAPQGRESDSDRRHAEPISSADTVSPTAPQSIRGRAFHRTVARLGIQTAQALGYAHDQGIVHRDVKPANLLLDRRGDLWVADFGMAGVQGDAGLTMTGDLPGTLRYMSPEQAAGKRALIDRRTDIYSLGATLYELLALQPAIVGSDRAEIIRRIAEQEPEPLRRLNPAVPVDLATIVTKALSKEPSKRYETARQLADDLERYLDGRPIAARPVGPLARTWRWCKRKPMQAGLAAGLVLALVVGFTGITWNWWKAQAAEQRALTQAANAAAAEKEVRIQAANAAAAEKEARTQAAKADAINKFLIDKLLGQASPFTTPGGNPVTLREALDRAAADVGSSFQGQPDIEVVLRMAFGTIYHVEEEYSKSEACYRAAYEILRTGPGKPTKEGIEAMSNLAHILCHLKRLEEAEPLILKALEEGRIILGPGHTITLTALDYLGQLHLAKGQLDKAEDVNRTWLKESTLALGPKAPETLTALHDLAVLLGRRGKNAESERLLRECLRFEREVHGPEHPHTLITLASLADALRRLGRLDESELLSRQCLEAQRRVMGSDHPRTLRTVNGLVDLLRSRGQLDEAESLVRTRLEAQRRTLGANDARTLGTAASLEAIRKERGKAKEAVKK